MRYARFLANVVRLRSLSAALWVLRYEQMEARAGDA